MIVAAVVVLISICVWFVNRRKAAQREQRYQTILTSYAVRFKPGMTRDKLEHYLQNNGIQIRYMCCASDRANLAGAGWDDLVKIGEESAPWVCKENNAYIALEFNPKSQGELPGTNDSDTLKRVTIFHQLEGCL
jgi:hypothetical protein